MFQSPKTAASSESKQAFASPHDEARALFSQAREELENLAGPGAIARIRQAVVLVDGAVSCPVEARVCVRSDGAKLLSTFGHPAHAEPFLAEAIQILVTSGNANETARIAKLQVRRGELLCELGRLPEAEACLQSAVELVGRGASSSPLAIRAKLDLGLVALRRGDDESSVLRYGTLMSEVFSECARAEPAERPELSRVLTLSASAFMDAGHFSQAVHIAREALSVYRQAPEGSDDACRMLRLFIAEVAHKAGHFDEALDLRRHLQHELRADARCGASSDLALQVAQSVGETLIEMKSFEQAEIVLRETFEAARQSGSSERALECAAILMNEYIVRHMEEEIVALRSAVSDIKQSAGPMYALLSRVDEELAFNDDAEGALARLDELLREVQQLTGAERVLGEAAILASKAIVSAAFDPEAARELILDVVSRLESIPPPFDEGIRERLSLAQARLAIVQSDPETAVRVLSRQIEELDRNEGCGRQLVRVKLMIQLAEALDAAGKRSEAVVLARRIVSLFEESKDVHSLNFAESLLLLAGLLGPDDPEHETAIERAVPIIHRYRQR